MKKGFFNAYQIKLFAFVLLVIDNLYTVARVGPSLIPLLTRFSVSLFTYFLVEDFYKYEDREEFLKLNLLFAGITQAGIVLINLMTRNKETYYYRLTPRVIMDGPNIFITFSVFVLIMMTLEKLKETKDIKYWRNFIILSVLSVLLTDHGFALYPLLLVLYYFFNNPSKLYLGILGVSGFNLLRILLSTRKALGSSFKYTLMYNPDWTFLILIPIIILYNHERGRDDSFGKWFFYFAYPVHGWAFMILSNILNKFADKVNPMR